MDVAENTSLKGMNSAIAAITQFKSQVVTILLHNRESWIGVTEEHIQKLLEIQNICLRRLLTAPLSGTPKGMEELDKQMFLMHLRIKQKKLCLIGKAMAKPDRNLCKNALKYMFSE